MRFYTNSFKIFKLLILTLYRGIINILNFAINPVTLYKTLIDIILTCLKVILIEAKGSVSSFVGIAVKNILFNTIIYMYILSSVYFTVFLSVLLLLLFCYYYIYFLLNSIGISLVHLIDKCPFLVIKKGLIFLLFISRVDLGFILLFCKRRFFGI